MINKTILHYRILEELGRGGMGVVYKANDTKLNRTVALKFLPTNVLQGTAEKQRFVREAQTAAALNHANIAHIYAIEETAASVSDSEGQMFIAMEYIEGQSLHEIIGSNGGSPLPLDKAADYTSQIATGLQAAHEKGIIHRDIKSANIMVSEKGVIKIMDFGLAKLAQRSKMTVQGSTLGTAAYMSPEQARGEGLDKRSDIWSLGVVLYEMITGQLPFKGDYEQAVIYSILNEAPQPLTALRSGLPIAMDGIIAKALAKDPATRYQHVDELPADLKALSVQSVSVSRVSLAGASTPVPSQETKIKNARVPWFVAGLSLVIVVITLLLSILGQNPTSSETIHLNLSGLTSANQNLMRVDVGTIALSPDGNTLVYAVGQEGRSQLYKRSLKSFDNIPIEGTQNGLAPFFSPDGQWIGFLSDGKLKKVSLSGSAVETICDASGFRGASWGADNTIVFSPGFSSGLMAVSAMGGIPRQISVLDTAQIERTHRWPQILPDGRWVLYTIGDQNNPNSYINARLAIQSLESGERHILDIRGEMARYVEPGLLIVARNGTLLAAPFDLETFKTTELPFPVLDNVDGDAGSGISYFTFSQNGRLVYIPGIRNQELELVWVDKQGNVDPLPLPKGAYSEPRFSPDGTRLAVTVGQAGGDDYDIWMYDLKSRSFNRFTFGKRMLNPAWGPEGKKLYFASNGGDKLGIFVKPADGSAPETIIFPKPKAPLLPMSVTPDGKKLILTQLSGATEGTILALDLINLDEPEPFTLFPSDFFGYGGRSSPDGRFITYGTNETGTLEIFVASYPDLKGKWQVSSAGGLDPTWSPDEEELYYVSPLDKMMVVPISTNPVFSSAKPRELFDVSQMFFPNSPSPNYDISPDGERFIMVRNSREASGSQIFNVIMNWIPVR